MLWFPNEARYWAAPMPDEDKIFGGSLVLDFGTWWCHVNTIYTTETKDGKNIGVNKNVKAS